MTTVLHVHCSTCPLSRYTKHSKRGKQRIESDEDELLYGCIKNIVGFMVALEVETKTIMKLISRLEGTCDHVMNDDIIYHVNL